MLILYESFRHWMAIAVWHFSLETTNDVLKQTLEAIWDNEELTPRGFALVPEKTLFKPWHLPLPGRLLASWASQASARSLDLGSDEWAILTVSSPDPGVIWLHRGSRNMTVSDGQMFWLRTLHFNSFGSAYVFWLERKRWIAQVEMIRDDKIKW